MTDNDSSLSRGLEERLDRLLAGWTQERGLTPTRAEELRRVVLSAPVPGATTDPAGASDVDLGQAWWRGLFDTLVATLSQTETATPAFVGPDSVGGPAPEVPGGHAGGHRAYLRLA